MEPYDYTEQLQELLQNQQMILGSLQELLQNQQMILGSLWIFIGVVICAQVLLYINGWRKW